MSLSPVIINKFKDQQWRLNNLYYITDQSARKIKFDMNAVQKYLYLAMWYLTLILKSRQHGITTFLCIFFLDTCLFNSNIHAGIIAHNREDAEAFFRDKIKFAYDNLPPALKQARETESENARELSFPNGSVIRVGTSMRSSTLQYLHISEFGKLCAKYPEKAREVVTGSLNTVHQGQFIFIESTAEGRRGYFHDYAMKALDLMRRKADLSQLDFKFFFFGWYDDAKNQSNAKIDIPHDLLIYFDELAKKGIKLRPEQKAWYALKTQQQGNDMHREFPSTPEEAFEATAADCFFTGAIDGHNSTATGQFIKLQREKQEKEFEVIESPTGIIEVWKYPYFLTDKWDKHHWTYRYCIGSDIGEGLGGDYSVAYVFDRHLRLFVTRMVSNKIDSHRWGDKLHNLSLFYENALIVPERNGAGITTMNRLIDLKANIYVKSVVATIGKQTTKQYGWQETHDSKQSLCGGLKAYLNERDNHGQRKNTIFCKALLDEAAVFIKDEEKDKLGAEEGCHDDHVIAAALCIEGDNYLPKCEKIVKPRTGWRERMAAEKKESAWAA
ncbi:MAG: hypothetical protein ABFD76_15295 [Smithella sp.]